MFHGFLRIFTIWQRYVGLLEYLTVFSKRKLPFSLCADKLLDMQPDMQRIAVTASENLTFELLSSSFTTRRSRRN